MPRTYKVTFENVAVSAAQDLVQIKGAAGKILKIKRVSVGATNTTLVTAQGLQIRCRFLPATVTDGSGGTVPTPQKMDPGDAAASFTTLVNNTSKASTSATPVVLEEAGVHIFAGHDLTFPVGTEPVVGPSESFVYELLSTVTGSTNMSGSVTVEEAGG